MGARKGFPEHHLVCAPWPAARGSSLTSSPARSKTVRRIALKTSAKIKPPHAGQARGPQYY
jgi:hypothetical protein